MYRQRAAQGQSTTLAFYDWKGIKSLLQSTFKVPVMISAVNQKKKNIKKCPRKTIYIHCEIYIFNLI